MYLCSTLDNGVCLAWVEYSSIFGLSLDEGLKIGGLLFLASASAWGVNALTKLLLNR